MLPARSGPLNPAYFADLTAQINSIDVCADLQAIVNIIMADIQAAIASIEAQIAALIPIIVIPTDLGEVISWIGSFIAPLIIAYETYVAQLAAMLAQVAALVSAIENAAARLVNCAVTIAKIV
jgi:hypothetical protein